MTRQRYGPASRSGHVDPCKQREHVDPNCRTPYPGLHDTGAPVMNAEQRPRACRRPQQRRRSPYAILDEATGEAAAGSGFRMPAVAAALIRRPAC